MTEEGQEGRDAFVEKRKPDFSRFPAPGREGHGGRRTFHIAGRSGVPLRIWLVAARPRTLPAAVAPVLVGTALAASEDVFRPLAFVAALLGSIFIQIGTNLANDYSDARRGADTDGPARTGAGDRRRARRAAAGAGRDLARVRRSRSHSAPT